MHRADLAELLGEVERCCSRDDWDALLALRDACDRAVEDFGKQLWSIADYAEYRLARDAPGEVAGSVLRPGAARFALGPLTEVAASTHTWDELADFLEPGPIAATVAQERVIRGEDLRGDERARGDEFGPPLVLQDWEPRYPLPEYREDELLENGPATVASDLQEVRGTATRLMEFDDLDRALRDIALVWAEHSNGGSEIVMVEGDAYGALSHLPEPPARARPIEASDAFARMAWSAASGGAHGRRRGLAFGRGAAFWVAQVVCDLYDLLDPAELGEALVPVSWREFEVADPTGWQLCLALEHTGEGWAAGIHAWDMEIEPDSAS